MHFGSLTCFLDISKSGRNGLHGAKLGAHGFLHKGEDSETGQWDHGPTWQTQNEEGDLTGGETRRRRLGWGRGALLRAQGNETSRLVCTSSAEEARSSPAMSGGGGSRRR